jgi:hypothetical protein
MVRRPEEQRDDPLFFTAFCAKLQLSEGVITASQLCIGIFGPELYHISNLLSIS